MNEALGKIDGDALAAEFERDLRRRSTPKRGSITVCGGAFPLRAACRRAHTFELRRRRRAGGLPYGLHRPRLPDRIHRQNVVAHRKAAHARQHHPKPLRLRRRTHLLKPSVRAARRQLRYPQRAEMGGTMHRPHRPISVRGLLADAILKCLRLNPEIEQLRPSTDRPPSLPECVPECGVQSR
jgi:hypothetical protein